MVAEVLSDDSTADYDRADKFDLLYATMESLREHVLIESTRIGVEVRRRGPDGSWAATRYGQGDLFVLESLDARFPVTDLYL